MILSTKKQCIAAIIARQTRLLRQRTITVTAMAATAPMPSCLPPQLQRFAVLRGPLEQLKHMFSLQRCVPHAHTPLLAHSLCTLALHAHSARAAPARHPGTRITSRRPSRSGSRSCSTAW